MDQPMDGLSKETRARISAAADKLYLCNGKSSFPTVDAVRKEAKCSMNDANAGMKEWRMEQKKTQVTSVAVEVPESVRFSASTAIASLWQEAQDLANESLRAAQAGWDADKLEIDTLNKQMAKAYDGVTAELETTREEVNVVRSDLEEVAQRRAMLEAQLTEATRELAAALAASETANARTIEIERRAGELRTELDHAHQEVSQAHGELAGVRRAHAAELDALRADLAAQRAKSEESAARSAEGYQALRAELADAKAKAGAEADALRTELATVSAKGEAAQEALREQRERSTVEANRAAEQLAAAQVDRDEARQSAAQAREQAAELRGQIEAVKDQNSKLMQTVKTDAKK